MADDSRCAQSRDRRPNLEHVPEPALARKCAGHVGAASKAGPFATTPQPRDLVVDQSVGQRLATQDQERLLGRFRRHTCTVQPT